VVGDLQIGLEFLETGPGALQLGVRDPHLADPQTGTSTIDNVDDISLAADVSEVELDAPT